MTLPRTSPDRTQEQRITLGTYERGLVADYIEATQQPDDFTLKGVLDTMNAAAQLAMPVAVLGAAYLAYLGAVNFSTGVDELKQRAAATPAGRTLVNVGRYNPLWRGLNWAFGGENDPIFPDVDLGAEGNSGGGGGGGF